jgi:hypothetical protein
LDDSGKPRAGCDDRETVRLHPAERKGAAILQAAQSREADSGRLDARAGPKAGVP